MAWILKGAEPEPKLSGKLARLQQRARRLERARKRGLVDPAKAKALGAVLHRRIRATERQLARVRTPTGGDR